MNDNAKYIIGGILGDWIDDCFDRDLHKLNSTASSHVLERAKAVGRVTAEIMKELEAERDGGEG